MNSTEVAIIAQDILYRLGEVEPFNLVLVQNCYSEPRLSIRGVISRGTPSYFEQLIVSINLPSEKNMEQAVFKIPSSNDDRKTVVLSARGKLNTPPDTFFNPPQKYEEYVRQSNLFSNTHYHIEYFRPGRWMFYLMQLDRKLWQASKDTLAQHNTSIDDSSVFPEIPDLSMT